ncbi:bifunctional adenosylcobinamide kinase/adenosylcobinamide-phosphate guanylyltransferase [Comamonas sp. Y33R10-2]|uniref:bifunctional adenosylcobinamide kinase/adenosylcobinamide-phosphate guanylyltransferase n=1 Tax=Comamonas sp. Y33R10-2 TaxID=2853257 RepID=UPI001C5C8FBC|nr:bifunctional adenosylcobinamide kinase/adenosylcobinamide-phosphate guanylyltransferase [Comamonas sp. Y33R10-2]QXZ11296.1 bifunctional adenosylcobinamide kinase/adenosylcobinamide-phosphate guanylyltransferase [Comamonas sp. Y33R10-2]
MPRTQFIVGGQKSGKSRRAELLARQWLQSGASHQAVLVATGQAWDAEMSERIARHQRDRAERVPGMQTIEEPRDLAQVIDNHSRPERLLVIDCLTLWLTNWIMPADVKKNEENQSQVHEWSKQLAMFLKAIDDAAGPIILVGNEIGLGVIPMGREVRAFVDALGVLNQQVAAHCESATLMCAGLPLALKGPQA